MNLSNHRETTPANPAGALCDLVARRCNVTINVEDLKAMFRMDWNKLSMLAHALHAEEQRKIAALDPRNEHRERFDVI